MNIRALIVEDEPLAIDRLRTCLSYINDLDVVGEALDGASAVKMIDRLQPDLVFLDVQLPTFSGFQVLRAVQHQPGVIFTTAHDTYAISAFEWGAFDYLLKPFDSARVSLAMERFRRRGKPIGSGDRLADQLETLESQGTLKRFFVKDRGTAVPIDCNKIVAILAEGDYCRVHLNRESHLVHLPLRDFEQRLARQVFLRVHRSAVINVSKVTSIGAAGRGAQVSMENGLLVPASRMGAMQLKRLRL